MRLKSIQKHWPDALIVVSVILFGMVDTAFFSLLPHEQLHHQWWRLITGHLVHTNFAHLLMNLAGFVLVSIGFGHKLDWNERLCVLVFLMLGVGGCITNLELYEYLGLSGVLHGYALYLLLRCWAEQPITYSILACLLSVKVISETLGLTDTASTQALIQAPIATASHLYGLLTGVLAFFIALLKFKTFKT